VQRIYCEERLQVTRRKRRRGVAVERRTLELPQAPNEVWSIDIVSDSLEHGRRLKCLTIVDDYTKEAIDIPVDHGISGEYVTRVLDRVGQFRGLPQVIRTDQGPESTGNALDRWAGNPSLRGGIPLLRSNLSDVAEKITKGFTRAADRTHVRGGGPRTHHNVVGLE
jgi:transposase InsO family protein